MHICIYKNVCTYTQCLCLTCVHRTLNEPAPSPHIGEPTAEESMDAMQFDELDLDKEKPLESEPPIIINSRGMNFWKFILVSGISNAVYHQLDFLSGFYVLLLQSAHSKFGRAERRKNYLNVYVHLISLDLNLTVEELGS